MTEEFQVCNNKTRIDFGLNEEIRDMAWILLVAVKLQVFPFKNYRFSLCPQCKPMYFYLFYFLIWKYLQWGPIKNGDGISSTTGHLSWGMRYEFCFQLFQP